MAKEKIINLDPVLVNNILVKAQAQIQSIRKIKRFFYVDYTKIKSGRTICISACFTSLDENTLISSMGSF